MMGCPLIIIIIIYTAVYVNCTLSILGNFIFSLNPKLVLLLCMVLELFIKTEKNVVVIVKSLFLYTTIKI